MKDVAIAVLFVACVVLAFVAGGEHSNSQFFKRQAYDILAHCEAYSR